MNARALSIATIATLAAACSSLAFADSHSKNDGPSPYPSTAQEWPGRGVVRVFDWMSQNREHFWRERSKKQNSIVFAGDSLTAQWPHLNAEFPSVTVANRGIGGDVSRGLLFRFEEDVLALEPKAVVILIGTNDLTARQKASDSLANVEAMIAVHQSRSKAPIILCTVPPSAHRQAPVDEQQLKILNAGLRAIAERSEHIDLVDLFIATATADGEPDPRLFKPDRLHLNAEGYARWKAALQPVLHEHGML